MSRFIMRMCTLLARVFIQTGVVFEKNSRSRICQFVVNRQRKAADCARLHEQPAQSGPA